MLKKSLRALTLTIATAGMVVGGVSAATASVWSPVANPSFRSPDVDPRSHTRYDRDRIPGWTVTRGNVDIIGRVAARTGSSSNALDLNGNQRGTIEQNIPVTANQRVIVTFRAGTNVYRDCRGNEAQSFSVGAAAQPNSFRTYTVGNRNMTKRANAKAANNKAANNKADDNKATANQANKAGNAKAKGNEADNRAGDDKAKSNAGRIVALDPQWKTITYEFSIPQDMATLTFRSESGGPCGAVITDIRVSENI